MQNNNLKSRVWETPNLWMCAEIPTCWHIFCMFRLPSHTHQILPKYKKNKNPCLLLLLNLPVPAGSWQVDWLKLDKTVFEIIGKSHYRGLHVIVTKCDMIHAIYLNFWKGPKKSLKCNLQNIFSISDKRARTARKRKF